jgi:hypothetical protein
LPAGEAEASDAAASPELPRIADGKKNATGNHGAAGIFFDLVRTRASTDLYTVGFSPPTDLASAIPPSSQRRLSLCLSEAYKADGLSHFSYAAFNWTFTVMTGKRRKGDDSDRLKIGWYGRCTSF